MAASGEPQIYYVGDWPAPFGIVLVLDRLSALMLGLSSALATASVLYAVDGDDARGTDFHPLFQFQLLGINGAFLTGDLFNLFVFFEILLIASYCLIVHGGGAARTRAAIHFVVLNLVGSSLFLIALGVVYGTLGTLNMADLAVKAASARPDSIGRRPVIALTNSVWPLPCTPAMPRISPSRTSNDTPSTAMLPRSSSACKSSISLKSLYLPEALLFFYGLSWFFIFLFS